MWTQILLRGKFIVIHRQGGYCGTVFFMDENKLFAYNREIGECDITHNLPIFNMHIDSLLFEEKFNVAILNSRADAEKLI